MVPSKWVSKRGQAEPEKRKGKPLLKFNNVDGSGETNAPSYKEEGPYSSGEALHSQGEWDGVGATSLQLNWFYHHLLEFKTVNKSQVVTLQMK